MYREVTTFRFKFSVLKQLSEYSAVNDERIRGPRTVHVHPVGVKPLHSCFSLLSRESEHFWKVAAVFNWKIQQPRLLGHGVFFCGNINVLKPGRGSDWYDIVKVLIATELYTLKRLISCDVNFTSIKKNIKIQQSNTSSLVASCFPTTSDSKSKRGRWNAPFWAPDLCL